MAVEPQIIAALDRIAKGKQTSLDAYATGTHFWDLVDAAQDET